MADPTERPLLPIADVYFADIELQLEAWSTVVRSAREALIKQRGAPPSCQDVWSLLCQVSDAGFANDEQFLADVIHQEFYSGDAIATVRDYGGYAFTKSFQILLNACSPKTADGAPWYGSYGGKKAIQLSADVVKLLTSTFPRLYDPTDKIHQTNYELEERIVCASAQQCFRLAHNHASMLSRPNHALFVEEHASTHECVVNDPNISSLQDLATALREPYVGSSLGVATIPVTTGFCQTWSLFELECNIMECAGVHEQLRERYKLLHYALVNKSPKDLQEVLESFGTPASSVLEAATQAAYGHLGHATAFFTLSILQDKLCRRLAHIFNYTKYPTADWPSLSSHQRRVPAKYARDVHDPMSLMLHGEPDPSNASFTSVVSKYRTENPLVADVCV